MVEALSGEFASTPADILHGLQRCEAHVQKITAMAFHDEMQRQQNLLSDWSTRLHEPDGLKNLADRELGGRTRVPLLDDVHARPDGIQPRQLLPSKSSPAGRGGHHQTRGGGGNGGGRASSPLR